VAVRVGVADVLFNSSAKFAIAGQPLPGANLNLSNNVTVAVEADYYLRRDLSLSVTVGAPPETNAEGRGVLAPLGRLGSVRYGPAVGLAKYHVSGLGRLQPWVGAGFTRMIVFSDTGGAVPDLKVKDNWGGAVQGGAEYMLGPRWGVYASVSHLFLRTEGSGSFSGLPVVSKIALDPTIIQGGLSYRF
jgi:outer membrane protein